MKLFPVSPREGLLPDPPPGLNERSEVLSLVEQIPIPERAQDGNEWKNPPYLSLFTPLLINVIPRFVPSRCTFRAKACPVFFRGACPRPQGGGNLTFQFDLKLILCIKYKCWL